MGNPTSQLSEINSIIIEIKYLIRPRKFFELGDNPDILSKADKLLENACKLLDELGTNYNTKPMKESNSYFSAIKTGRQMREFFAQVNKSGVGTQDNTYRGVEFITKIETLINVLAENASINLFPFEVHLKKMRIYLDDWREEHPVRKRFENLSRRLQTLHQNGEITGGRHVIFEEFDELLRGIGGPRFEDIPSIDLMPKESVFRAPLLDPLPIEKYWAVLVGVELHDQEDIYGQLPNASNDVTKLAETLLSTKSYKPERLWLFSEKIQPSLSLPNKHYDSPEYLKVSKLLFDLGRTMNENDLFFMYFSGHGVPDKKSAYLVFRDTQDEMLDKTAYEMQRLYNEINNLPAKVKIVVLDNCFAGAIIKTKSTNKMSEDFLKFAFSSAEGIAVITSCKADERSFPLETSGTSLSAFTYFFIEALKSEGRNGKFVTIDDLKDYVTSAVINWSLETGKPQTPQYRFSGTGNPIFAEWLTGE